MRVLFIGYSVTIQTNGFFDYLKQMYQDKDIHVEHIAIGGANMNWILYYLNAIDFKQYNSVVLEISTSTRWLGSDYNRYMNIISFIVDYISLFVNKIGFLDFSRTDVSINDVLHQVIADCAIYKNLPIISWDNAKGELSSYVYDGIHPNAQGIRLYAELANSLLDLISNKSSLNYHAHSGFYNLYEKYKPFFMSINQLLIVNNQNTFENFSKGGINYDLLVIEEGNKVEIKLDKDYEIMGLLLKIGPKTGRAIVSDSISGDILVDKTIYDERSYYERYFPFFQRMGRRNHLTLSCIRCDSRTQLLKRR